MTNFNYNDTAIVDVKKELDKIKGSEILIVRGKYQGKFGWVNVSKGNHGYTPCMVYVIYVDEDGKEVVANRIKRTSIEIQSWKTKPTMSTKFLMQNPKVSKKVSELCKLLQEISFTDEVTKKSVTTELLALIQHKVNA